jgi:small-conductance mechanosensitive channel
MQDMNLAIKQRFDQEHIEFAFPTQTLYLKAENDGNGTARTTPTQLVPEVD